LEFASRFESKEPSEGCQEEEYINQGLFQQQGREEIRCGWEDCV